MLAHAATLLLLAVLFVGVPLLAARTARNPKVLELPRPALYVSAALSQWLLVPLLALVLWAEGRGLEPLRLRPLPPWGALAAWTLALTAAGLLVVAAAHLLGAGSSPLLDHLLPRTPRERLLFALLVSPTAGLVEEALYRGWALSRLEPWLGSGGAAVAAAAAFALAHVYQGLAGGLRVLALGLLLALPVVLAGTLLPAILAHALIDVLGGLWLGPRLFRASRADGA